MAKGVRSFARGAQLAVLGASSLALMGQSAWAQGGARDREDPITVTGVRGQLESPRYTAPLLDTPQTVTVVTGEVIEQQNLHNLREVLATLPGITFGAGEGGGGYGDSINLRGYDADGDITVDGVRDSAQYSRTDPFNLEQIEVTSGANSVYGGAGSVGGSINLVTKRPRGSGESVVSVGAGTDEYGRFTLDMDEALGDGVGMRLNVMAHENDVPGREVENYSRWGIAPSITFGLGSPTRVTAMYLHQEDENIPQYGVPYALNAFNDGIVAGANREAYYGWSNVDAQEIGVDQATLIVEHDFSSNLSLRNLTRAQRVTQDAVITNLGSSDYCTDAGIDPYSGAACAPAGTRTLENSTRTNYRNSENDLIYNQTDLSWRFNTGGIEHNLVTGLSLSREEYSLDSGRVLYSGYGAPVITSGTPVVFDLSDPDHVYTGAVSMLRTRAADAELENYALYAFDAIELNEQWEFNAGVRLERHESSATIVDTNIDTGVVGAPASADTESDLFSYRAGLVYKPVPNASFYIAYGNSESPPQTTVLIGSPNALCTADGICDGDPEEAETTEIGVKWDVFDARLSLTAAIFRNERSAFYIENPPGVVELQGASRVDGVTLGASGLITRNWSVFANYTYLDSELLETDASSSYREGDPLPYTPEHSFSLWTTYEPVHGLLLGYGATYQGEITFNRFSAASPLFYTDSYWVHRASVEYSLTRDLTVQLNVNNLFDEDYYERIRNNSTNGWATPGAARSAVLSLNYRF